MFDSILGGELTPLNFFICVGAALVLGLIVAAVNIWTAEKSNKNFAISLATLPALVAVVIMLVNGNVGTAVATVGAFSLVRFRSIPGNSRSILAIFFSMAIGLAIGTGYVVFAALFTIIVSLSIVVLSFLDFGGNKTPEQRLTIVVPEDLDYTDIFDEVFAENLDSHMLIKTKTINMGSLFELNYRIRLKPDIKEKAFIDKIRARNGNLKVSLSHVIIEAEEL